MALFFLPWSVFFFFFFLSLSLPITVSTAQITSHGIWSLQFWFRSLWLCSDCQSKFVFLQRWSESDLPIDRSYYNRKWSDLICVFFWQYSFHIGCYSHDVASGSRSSLLKQTKMEDNEMDLLIYHIAVWSYGMCFIKIMRPCQILRSLRALLDFLHQQTSMFSACIMEKWTLYYLSYLFIASSVWTVISAFMQLLRH